MDKDQIATIHSRWTHPTSVSSQAYSTPFTAWPWSHWTGAEFEPPAFVKGLSIRPTTPDQSERWDIYWMNAKKHGCYVAFLIMSAIWESLLWIGNLDSNREAEVTKRLLVRICSSNTFQFCFVTSTCSISNGKHAPSGLETSLVACPDNPSGQFRGVPLEAATHFDETFVQTASDCLELRLFSTTSQQPLNTAASDILANSGPLAPFFVSAP